MRPGEKQSWTVPLKLPKGMDTRRDEVTLQFEDEAGEAPPDVTTSFGVVEVAKPIFAFSVQVDDSQGGNGDGLAQRGETFDVRVDVRNAGTGASGEKTWVSLKNLGDDKLFIKKGRDTLGALKPGEVKSARMEVELRSGSKSETLPIRVMVVDEKMDEYVSEKLDWPIAKDEPATTVASGAVRVEVAEAVLRSGASAAAAPIASAKKGAVLPVDAKVGEFYRVEWQKGRARLRAAADVKVARGRARGTIAAAWQREPPRIALVPDPQKGAPVVEGDHLEALGQRDRAALRRSRRPAARRVRVRERAEGVLQGPAGDGDHREARVHDGHPARDGEQRRDRVRARGRRVPVAPLHRRLPQPARRGGRGRARREGAGAVIAAAPRA